MVPSPPKMSAASGWSVGSNSLPENRFTPGRSNRPRWCSLATGPRRATARTALLSHRRHEIQNRDLTRKVGRSPTEGKNLGNCLQVLAPDCFNYLFVSMAYSGNKIADIRVGFSMDVQASLTRSDLPSRLVPCNICTCGL